MLEYLLTLLMSGLVTGSVYTVTALGLTMVYGILNLMNFAHGEVFMVGAYVGYFLFTVFGVSYPIAILGAIVGAAATGLLIEAIAFRPLRNAPQLSPLIASLGVSIFLQNLALLIWSPTPRMFNTPYVDQVVHMVIISMSMQRVIVFVVCVILIVVLCFVVQSTAIGKAMRAVALDPEAAALVGIDSRKVIVATFAIGSGLAGVAGALVGPILILSPFMGIPIILKAFAVVIMGGFGSIQGTVLAGFILGITESFGVLIIPTAFIDTIAFVLLIATLLVRPTGLFAERLEENV
jgi:branched-chain amino acid transport system permease protein